MSLSVRRLHPTFAAEVSGLVVAGGLDPQTASQLRDAIHEHAVVVLRDQPLTDEDQLLLSQQLGRPHPALKRKRAGQEHRLSIPELTDISNLDENNQLFKRDDRRRMRSLGNRMWHSDTSFQPVRGEFSILSARGSVPSTGGETEYADLRSAYEALDPEMKEQLRGLQAEHDLFHSRGLVGFTDFSQEERDFFKPAHHPVVSTHVSGRETLYLGAHASHIVDWPLPEGRVLLYDLTEFATQPQFVYRHSWRPHDIVIWDNRCTMHRGRAFNQDHVRDLRRITTLDLEPVLT